MIELVNVITYQDSQQLGNECLSPEGGGWGSGQHATASIIDSKFKCLRDNKIMGTVAFKLNIHASVNLPSATKYYTLKEVRGRGKKWGGVDSGGQGWGEFAGISFLSVSCDTHSPKGLMSEALFFTPDLLKAWSSGRMVV